MPPKSRFFIEAPASRRPLIGAAKYCSRMLRLSIFAVPNCPRRLRLPICAARQCFRMLRLLIFAVPDCSRMLLLSIYATKCPYSCNHPFAAAGMPSLKL
jgi:hypothetical protein